MCCRKLRIYGVAYSLKAYEIRDFLNRSVVEFDWIDSSCPADVATKLGLPPLGFEQMPVVGKIAIVANLVGHLGEPLLDGADRRREPLRLGQA